MPVVSSRHKVHQITQYVNPSKNPPLQLAFPGMIHHNVTQRSPYLLVGNNVRKGTSSYGVSKHNKVMSPGLLLKRFDQVKRCLAGPLKLTRPQQEAVMQLLRLYSYYGLVYPKAAQIANEPTDDDIISYVKMGRDPAKLRGSYGCSRATFWRTIKKLKAAGLIEVVNRYLFREHAQISNLYKLDNLLIVIARYLAEHGQVFHQKRLKWFLLLSGDVFWSLGWTYGQSPPS